MKRLKLILGLLFLFAVPLFAGVNVVHAQRFSSTVASNEVVYGSVYGSGKDVNIHGTIYGDVYCAGSKVHINATIYGGVLCTGSHITIEGKIDGNVRAAGQIIDLRGDVSRNATLAGFTVLIDTASKIGQDATIMSSNATIKGDIVRDAITSGTKAVVEGSVGRNLVSSNAAVELQGKGRVAGDLTYSSNDAVKIGGEAMVLGKTNHQEQVKKAKRPFSPIFFLIVMLGLTLITVLLTVLLPSFLERTNVRLKTNFLKSFIVGLLCVLLLPPATFILTASFIGVPLMGLLLMGVIFGGILSTPIVAYRLGDALFKNVRPIWIAAGGSLILASSYFLPLIGLILVCVVFFTGFGALLLEIWSFRRRRPDAAVAQIASNNDKAAMPAGKPTKSTKQTATKKKSKSKQ